MCGIGGVFTHHAGDSIDPQLLVNMAAIQAHRGPDGFGYQIHDSGVGMTHARLSIIDLEGNRARQPFRSSCDRVLMAHNGEFYDFQRIRAELVAQGVHFNSKSDSEILLHLYLRQGLRRPCRNCAANLASPCLIARKTACIWCVIASASSPCIGR